MSEDCGHAARRRLQRWSEEPEQLLMSWRAFVRTRPPAELACCILRTACQAWCTTMRFSRPAEVCGFCREAGANRHSHYLQCPLFREWMRSRLGLQIQGGAEEMTSLH